VNRARPGFPARLAVPEPLAKAAPGGAGRGLQPKPPKPASGTVFKPNMADAGVNRTNLAIKNIANQVSLSSASSVRAVATHEHAGLRTALVAKLRAQGIADEAVLAAIGQVQRHRFVDTALLAQAYEDTSLPIGLGQTISKPNVVARMMELLRAAPIAQTQGLGRVLEIGTGCGYQAALLAQVAREVYSIERLRGLHDKARENLRPFRLANVHLLFGDGMLGYSQGAPYAGIIAAAGGQAVPQAWVDQLAVGARIVAPVVTANGTQALAVLEKTAQGLTQAVLEAVHFVPLKSGVG
jgi:protein-L-isoaspartate(D-aspartate) O-methyltransferase